MRSSAFERMSGVMLASAQARVSQVRQWVCFYAEAGDEQNRSRSMGFLSIVRPTALRSINGIWKCTFAPVGPQFLQSLHSSSNWASG
jgi:hypothetical protein